MFYIIIVGVGIVGLLVVVFLWWIGYWVEIYECILVNNEVGVVIIVFFNVFCFFFEWGFDLVVECFVKVDEMVFFDFFILNILFVVF